MFGMTIEVLENLSKLNQQQIKQTQQPPAGSQNGAVEDASKKAAKDADNAKEVGRVEEIVDTYKANLQQEIKSKLKDAEKEAKQKAEK
jgi:hypothetical protein